MTMSVRSPNRTRHNEADPAAPYLVYKSLKRLVGANKPEELLIGWQLLVESRMAKAWSKQVATFRGFTSAHVPYSDFGVAFDILEETLSQRGLYVWGSWVGREARVQYIGITAKSFKHRFKRYVTKSGTRKNCEITIAERHEQVLRALVDDWKPHIRRSDLQKYIEVGLQPPLRLATRFPRAERYAKNGLQNLWYYLIPAPPTTTKRELCQIESQLVHAANSNLFWQWYAGKPHSFPLLNKVTRHNLFMDPQYQDLYDAWLDGAGLRGEKPTITE